MTSQFHAPISPHNRGGAWTWPYKDGQPYDQHVREMLMRDDDAVLAAMEGEFVAHAYFQSEMYLADRVAGMWG